jgi:hypothetical protein
MALYFLILSFPVQTPFEFFLYHELTIKHQVFEILTKEPENYPTNLAVAIITLSY